MIPPMCIAVEDFLRQGGLMIIYFREHKLCGVWKSTHT